MAAAQHFKKRSGTSGISGHLYETKLLSLILFKLLHDDDIQEFHLASNMDEIGAFDDICLKARITGIDKPILAFIQAKHKDDGNTYLNYDLIKNFHISLVKVKEKIESYNPKRDSVFFKDNYNDLECLFILYTNAKFFDDPNVSELDQAGSITAPVVHDTRKLYDTEFADKLNLLINTSINTSKGCHVKYKNEDLEYISQTILEEEIATLVEHFGKFLNDNEKQSMNIMLDEYILRYHVILRLNVVNVSEIEPHTQEQTTKTGVDKPQKATESWRYVTFKSNFFDTKDKTLTVLRNKIYEFLTKNRGNTKKTNKNVKKNTGNTSSQVEDFVSSFLTEPSAKKLSYLINTYIAYTDRKLKFMVDRPTADQQRLEQIDISSATVDEAQAIKFLMHLKLKVPVTFGNLDMTFKGNEKKIGKRLFRLTSFLHELCQRSISQDSYEIVTIGKDIDEDYLSLSGGIGGAVGNLLVYDHVTKLLKFTEDNTSLKKYAKTLFELLNEKNKKLNTYRFNIQTINFPKLILNCVDEAKVILDKLLIYEKQSNHSGVEELLVREIKKHEESSTTQTLPTKLETISVYYHHEIQEWWLKPILGSFLTKTSDIYQKAIKNIINEPQMCALQNTFFNNIQNRVLIFNDDAMDSFVSVDRFLNIVVITDVVSLMVMKVIQCLRNKDDNQYIVIDLKHTLHLPIKEFRALNSELSDTEKIIILVCDGLENSGSFYKRLLTISQSVEEKSVIIVANKDFIARVNLNELIEYFSQISNVLEEENINLTSFDLESQINITENAKVIFQDQEIYLKSIVEEESYVFIKGMLLNKIICDETIAIGGSFNNSKYDEIKHLYVERQISRALKHNEYIYVRTFNDIEQNYVVITAEAGMGKSILLTHLSFKTKEYDNNIWILRINLLDYSKVFHDWQKDETVIDTLETVRFLCQALLKDKSVSVCLNETNNKIYLEDCTGNELTSFEINMFLQFYNNGKILILFDGFDEICPHYKNNVLRLLKAVINFPQKNKMWVTSRPYNEILPDLEAVLGKSYKIEYITDAQQENYLRQIWQTNLTPEKLSETQLSNIKSFANCISEKLVAKSFIDSMHFTYRRIYFLFYDFVQEYINNKPSMFPADPTEPVASTSKASDPINKIVDKLVGTPLLLYLVGNYFIYLINNEVTLKWELDINIIKIYELFIVTKIKHILLEEKNKMSLYIPDVINRYERDRDECIDVHKRMAAIAILKDKIFYDVCPLDEFKDMQPFKDQKEFETMIAKFKTGTEKTGIINHVTLDNIPVFIHRTFGEYFASEYLSDILKSETEFDNKKLLFTAIYTYGSIDIRPWLNAKSTIDQKLNEVIENIYSKKLVVLTWHRELFSRGDWSIEHLLRWLSSGPDDYKVDWCSEITKDHADTLNVLEPAERAMNIKKMQRYVYSKMKPHLKKHFTGTLPLRGHRQMINWMGGKLYLP